MKGLRQISDTGALEKIVDDVLAANPKQVEQYRGGKTTVIGFPGGAGDEGFPRPGESGAVNELLKKTWGEMTC